VSERLGELLVELANALETRGNGCRRVGMDAPQPGCLAEKAIGPEADGAV
jgi:hypothetical protein